MGGPDFNGPREGKACRDHSLMRIPNWASDDDVGPTLPRGFRSNADPSIPRASKPIAGASYWEGNSSKNDFLNQQKGDYGRMEVKASPMGRAQKKAWGMGDVTSALENKGCCGASF